MIIVSIIGTAGRNGLVEQVDPDIYSKIVESVKSYLVEIAEVNDVDISDLRITSGGAALSDHVAVTLYFGRVTSNITLHLPCSFDAELSEYRDINNGSISRSANRYHQQFSKQCQIDSLKELSTLFLRSHNEKGININIHNGFFKRNRYIAKCVYLIALTLGSSVDRSQHYIYDIDDNADIGLVKGGTAYTWNEADKSNVVKIHIPIESLK